MTTPTMTVMDLQSLLAAGQPVTVLDIRSVAEREEWAIPGSVHLDTYEALQAGDTHLLDGIEPVEGQPVVVVCVAGRTSLLATDYLRSRGISAYSLKGGMRQWSLSWNLAELPTGEPTFQLIQLRRTGKGCLSYLIASAGEAAVIDPSLPAELYLELATARGWTITHVLESHIHADHLSRARQLAAAAGALLALPAQERADYPFHPLYEGDRLQVGQHTLTVLQTPGHTLESVSYQLAERFLFTGDTLFLDAVGRPDLEGSPDEVRHRARLLYRSLQRLLALDPATIVLPGHTHRPVPFDGVPLAAYLAQIRPHVPLLELDENSFLEQLLALIPPTPPNHQQIIAFNEAGEMPEGDPTELEAGANRCAIR